MRRGGVSLFTGIKGLLAGLQKNGPAAKVFIESPGGQFEFFSTLAPVLIRMGYHAVGRDVRSPAIILQLLGRRRFATPDAIFFFHEVRTIVRGQHVTICDLDEFLEHERDMGKRLSGLGREAMQEWRNSMARAQGWMLSFIQEQTGINGGTFANLMRDEVILSAQEAVRYGIVHRVASAEEILSSRW